MPNYNITILDINGNVLQSIPSNINFYGIDLRNLPNGIFFIKIQDNNNMNVKLEKIIKY